jgi:hypothetical protein
VNIQRYHDAAELGAGWVRGLVTRPVLLERLQRIRVGVGVYLACGSDGSLCYVGSAVRPNAVHGLAARVFEHPLTRRARWREAWILPFREDTPRKVVHAVEGQIIELLRPPDNRVRHLPRWVVSDEPNSTVPQRKDILVLVT